MPATLFEIRDDLIVLRVTGQAVYGQWTQVQQRLGAEIERLGRVRILVYLDAFAGWARDDGWSDLEFFNAHDAHIAAIAVVGDPRWEDSCLTFALAGMRRAPVRFFSSEGPALAWLADPGSDPSP